jgi:ABC-type nitrate/sulfonate/bicarbonate transport system substrate-binding protein
LNRIIRTTASLTLLHIFVCLFSGSAYAQPVEKIIIAYSAISPFQVIVKVAEDSGIFSKNGLETKLVFIEGGSRGAQALLAGEVPFVVADGASAVTSRLAGADTTILIGLVNTFPYTLISAPEIREVNDLKGKKVAISRFGSATDLATRFALRKVGLNADRDVTMLQIGAQNARFAALTAGSVQAAVITPPFTLTARKLGYKSLLNMVELNLPTAQSAVLTTDSVIRRNPDLAAKVVKSFVDAIHFYRTQKKESIRILKKFLGYTSDEEVEEAYNEAGLKLVSPKPYPTREGIQLILQTLEEKDPKARNRRAEEFVNVSFLEKLDKSGYIDQLYAKSSK